MMEFDEWYKKHFDEYDFSKKLLKNAHRDLPKTQSAVYAISGDPPTWGHADIMMRAAKKFDVLHWVIGKNPLKKYLFTEKEKLQMMEVYVNYYKLDNVILESVEGSIARYSAGVKANFLIRGLRSSSDYQSEYEQSIGNRGIAKNIETICMFTKPHFATISSSIVRDLAKLDETISQYVHPEVEEIIKASLNKGKK